MPRPLLQARRKRGTGSDWRRGRGRIFCLAGGLLRIPAFESFAVLFSRQIAHQTFDHRGGVGIPFCQIDKRAAEDDLAPCVQLARLRRFPVLQGKKSGLGLGIAFLCPVQFCLCHFARPYLRYSLSRSLN